MSFATTFLRAAAMLGAHAAGPEVAFVRPQRPRGCACEACRVVKAAPLSDDPVTYVPAKTLRRREKQRAYLDREIRRRGGGQ